MIWPFCPRPEFTEALTWRTDVLPTYSAEQRVRLTHTPRQAFGYEFGMTHRQFERARVLMASNGAGEWDLPVWAERQRVTCAGGAGTLTVDTTASDYRAGGKALLWASDEACELVTIDTVNASSLVLDGVTVSAYTNGIIAPVRTAYCLGGLTSTSSCWPHRQACKPSGSATTARICPMVRCTAPTDHIRWSTTARALGSPHFPSWSPSRHQRSITACRRRRCLPHDPFLTAPSVWRGCRRPFPDLWAVRCWLHSIRGAQKAFWLPMWSRGITLAADISAIDTTITIRSLGLNGVAETGDLFLRTLSGAKYTFRYTSVAASGQNDVLTLSAAAGASIAAAAVDVLCPLHCVRLEQDRVEFAHLYRGRDRQITTIQLRAIEVPVP
jgi:hypothetical protein